MILDDTGSQKPLITGIQIYDRQDSLHFIYDTLNYTIITTFLLQPL